MGTIPRNFSLVGVSQWEIFAVCNFHYQNQWRSCPLGSKATFDCQRASSIQHRVETRIAPALWLRERQILRVAKSSLFTRIYTSSDNKHGTVDIRPPLWFVQLRRLWYRWEAGNFPPSSGETFIQCQYREQQIIKVAEDITGGGEMEIELGPESYLRSKSGYSSENNLL